MSDNPTKTANPADILDQLVEFIVGDGITVSLVALPSGLRVGATAGDEADLRAVTVTWARLEQMRKAAKKAGSRD